MTRKQWLRWARDVDASQGEYFWLIFPRNTFSPESVEAEYLLRPPLPSSWRNKWDSRNHRVLAALLVGEVLGTSGAGQP